MAFVRAASYLARAQMPNGAWAVDAPPSTSPANANSTGLAVGGLRAIGRVSRMLPRTSRADAADYRPCWLSRSRAVRLLTSLSLAKKKSA